MLFKPWFWFGFGTISLIQYLISPSKTMLIASFIGISLSMVFWRNR